MSILTKEEGARRWRLVRAEMTKRGLECLIIWGNFGRSGQMDANLRYLANAAIEGYLILPLQGEPTIFTFVPHEEPSLWVTDCRSGHPTYSKAIMEQLQQLHLDKAKIGVVPLSGYYGETGFPYTPLMALKEGLPKARFEDASGLIEEVRVIKSPAEIKCIEAGCEVGEKAIESVMETAHPGANDNEVKARMQYEIMMRGCETFNLLLFGSGKALVSAGRHVSAVGYAYPRVLERGDVILTEFDAKYLGYIAQFNQPFAVGEPSREFRRLSDTAVRSFNEGLKSLKPGITVKELDDAFQAPIKEAGYVFVFPHFHGLGMSLEEPFSTFPYQPNYKANVSRVIKKDMVIEIEPHVITQDKKQAVHVGCPVLVTDTGYRLLTKKWKAELKVIPVK